MRRFWFTGLFLLVALALAARPCLGFEFTVEGEVIVGDENEGRISAPTNYYFTAEVRDCESRIRIFGGWYSKDSEYYEYCWDGSNSYIFVKFHTDSTFTSAVMSREDGKLTQRNIEEPVRRSNDGSLSMYLEGIPQNYQIGFIPVWLAYASHCHFKSKESGEKVEPIWGVRGTSLGQDEMGSAAWSLARECPASWNQ